MHDELRTRYETLLARIESAKSARSDRFGNQTVNFIAVSKTQPIEAIEALYHLGHRDFGENYAQELAGKAETLKNKGCDKIRWHFLGHLQSNKVKLLVPHLSAVHSVDSLKLAQELNKRWISAGREGNLPVFLEVNIDEEPNKSGVSPSSVQKLIEATSALERLTTLGLMCIPAIGTGKPGMSAFGRLRELELSLRPLTQGQLSMGMTGDFEAAIAEGATHVRIGTALFGERKRPI